MGKKTIVGEDGKNYRVHEKKPFYKRWWFIAFVVMFLMGGLLELFGSDTEPSKSNNATETTSNSSNDQKETDQKEADKKAKKEQEAATKASKEADKKKEEEKKAADAAEAQAALTNRDSYNTGITYDQLARTPDDYSYKNVKFYGKVVQVMEGDDSVQLRVAIDDNYDTMAYVEYDPSIVSQRVLEDDLITFYGISAGLISYESTLGGKISIPGVLAYVIDFN